MMRNAVMLAGLLAACAGAQKPPAGNAQLKDGTVVAQNGQPKPVRKIVCSWDQTVGTHFPEKVCRDQADIDQQRAETQESINALPRNQALRGQ